MTDFGYIVTLEDDDNGTVFGTCPALPEVSLFGKNRDAALAHAVEAIEEAIGARMDGNLDFPGPIDIRLVPDGSMFVAMPTGTLLKIGLYGGDLGGPIIDEPDLVVDGVAVRHRIVGGYHLFTSRELHGLYVADRDRATAERELSAAIKMLRDMESRR